MWENELMAFWFAFYLLIGIFLLLLVMLIREHSAHRELIAVLRSLPVHSHCKEEGDAPAKEGND